jgi:hypothetical protein
LIEPKKVKIQTFKKMNKLDEGKMPPVGFVHQVAPDAYYIRSDSAPGGWIFTFNSLNEGWLCDCMWFTIHENIKPPHPECKHIKIVKNNIGKQSTV